MDTISEEELNMSFEKSKLLKRELIDKIMDDIIDYESKTKLSVIDLVMKKRTTKDDPLDISATFGRI